MASIEFKIVTPDRIVYQDRIDSVTIPTTEGEITVLPNHIPLVTILTPGELVVRKAREESYMAVSGGFATVHRQNKLVILADTAERAEELTLEAIEQARERAKTLLEERRGKDEVAFADAAAGLERELARLKVARKHRARGSRTTAPVVE